MINENEEILNEKREPRQLKTPSTSHVSHAGLANLKEDEIFKEFTPQQFDSECPRLSNVGTDEHGNRSSIVPGSARPSSLQRQSSSVNSFNSKSSPVTRIPKVTSSVKKTAPKVIQKPMSSVPQLRQNFVKMNTNQNYKSRVRGAAYTTKIMAKRSNSLAARARFAKKMQIEQLKNRDQVNMYGGLGKVGLDYQQEANETKLYSDESDAESKKSDENEIPVFSSSAKTYMQ